MYRLIKPFYSIAYGPVTLPVGTIVTWSETHGIYISEAIDGICVPIEKWAVESWHDFFEKVEA